MAQLAGIFYFDGAPPSEADHVRAVGGLSDLAGNQITGYEDSGVLMVESGPRRPAASPSLSGSYCTWDGRLDNREDLLARLGERASKEYTDGDFALRVYEKEGVAGLRELIGDWSLVIWDRRTRTIVIASDYAGVRQLYYHRAPNRLLWSSSLAHLAQWCDASDIDHEYVANFLTRGVAADNVPYSGIHPAPTGGAVKITERRLSTDMFWSFPSAETRYRHGEEYAEHLRSLFRQAIAVRLRTTTPVVAELSGGLDSSSVVCVANDMVRSRAVKAPELTTVSYRHDGCADEKFFRLVENYCGLPGIHLNTNEHPFVLRDRVGASAPLFWEPRFCEVSRRLALMGATTFVTGQLGDLVMGNWLDDSEQVADLLTRRRFSAAMREAIEWSHSLRTPVYSIIWRAARAALGQWTGSANLDLASGSPDETAHGNSLTPALRTLAAQLEQKRARRAAVRDLTPTRAKRFWALTEALNGRRLQCPEPLQHISYTHPFAHRPLVEFMMTIPAAIVCRPGSPRDLMRRSLAGLVPQEVLRRRSKAIYSAIFQQSLAPLAVELLESREPLHLIDGGFVDAKSVKVRLDRLRHGIPCNASQLRHVILLEFWLRGRTQRAFTFNHRDGARRTRIDPGCSRDGIKIGVTRWQM